MLAPSQRAAIGEVPADMALADVAPADVAAVSHMLSTLLKKLGLDRHLQVVAPDPSFPPPHSAATPGMPSSPQQVADRLPSGAWLELTWIPPASQQATRQHE